MREEAIHPIRGASLLVAGRGVGMFLNLAGQVLIVRYLGQTSYGAFAYALSIAALAEGAVMLGLDKAVIRFVPIYHERGDAGRVLGTIIFVIGVVASIAAAGMLVLVVLFGSRGDASLTNVLLLTLIWLAPIQALDRIAEQLLAILGSPRSIVVRKHLVGPALKLIAAIAITSTGQAAEELAVLYVAAGAIGLLVYLPLLIALLRRHHLIGSGSLRQTRFPVLELLAFAIPLLSLDVAHLVQGTLDVVILEWHHGPAEVAALRAVQPVSRLNGLIFLNFALLFTPLVGRLFARGDREGIGDVYWLISSWLAVVSFPLFMLTFALAQPLTLLLFGDAYAGSAPIMAILSLGYYVNAALGLNSETLRVFGRIRYLVVGALGTASLNLALLLVLVPPLGALGAAISDATTLLALNLYNQIGLRMAVGIAAFDRNYASVYVSILVVALAVAIIQLALAPPPVVILLLVVITALAVLRINRSVLRVDETFPELLRVPLIGRLLR